jgi:hypothetical protein
MDEHRWRCDGGSRSASVVLEQQKSLSVFQEIMEESPAPFIHELEHGSGGDLPPLPGDGDNRPDPDFLLIFVLGFGIGFCGFAFADYCRRAVIVMRGRGLA